MSAVKFFDVEVNATEVRKVELRLGKQRKQAPTAIMRALNRAAQSARTAATKEVRQEYHVRAKDVNKTFRTYKASRKKLAALVVSRDHKLPLDKFKFSPRTRPKRPPKGGIKVAVKKDGLKNLMHAFLVDAPGGTMIFQRVGRPRYPIRRLMGPSVPQMIGAERVRTQFFNKARETYQKRLDHEIRRLLEVSK